MTAAPTSPEVTVVYPCLNEAGTIAESVRRALDVMAKNDLAGEVLVADNGSTDGSRELAAEAGARVVPVASRGYGNALYGGFSAARGRYLVHLDCDLSYPIEELPRYVQALRDGADLAMGSRLQGTIEPGAMPLLHRYLGTPVLTTIANVFFRCGISDINCGMRGLTKEAFERLDLRTGGMEFASEMVIKAALLGMRITEFPIPFYKDQRGRPPHLRSFRDGWRHLRFMLLFSPTWLFFLPGLLLVLAGAGTIAAIFRGVDVRLGLATTLLAHAAIVTGLLAMLLGVAAQGFAHLKRLYRGGALSRLQGWLELEVGIVIGLGLIILGGGTLGWSFLSIHQFMAQPGYQPGVFDPASTRWAVVGATLVIAGMQVLFASFFASLFKIEPLPELPPQ